METSKTLKDAAELVAVGDPDEQGWNKLLVYQKETRTFTLLRNFFMGNWCVDFKVLEYEEGYKVIRKMVVDFQQTMMLVDGWDEMTDDRYATINADVLEDEEEQ